MLGLLGGYEGCDDAGVESKSLIRPSMKAKRPCCCSLARSRPSVRLAFNVNPDFFVRIRTIDLLVSVCQNAKSRIQLTSTTDTLSMSCALTTLSLA